MKSIHFAWDRKLLCFIFNKKCTGKFTNCGRATDGFDAKKFQHWKKRGWHTALGIDIDIPLAEKGRAITFQGIVRCDDLMTTMFNALAIRLLLLASTLRTRSYFVSMGGELPLSVV